MRTKAFKTFVLGLVCLLASPTFSVGAAAQNDSVPEGVTLPMAVDIALRTNPLVRATASGRELAVAQLAEARAGRLPLIQLNETMTRGNNPVFVFGSLLEQARFGPQNLALDALNRPDSLTNFRSSIGVRFPVFDQFQTSSRIAKAEIGERQADAQRAFIEQNIRFEVVRAFYGVMIAEAQRKVADDALETAEADLKRVRDLFETGIVVASDMLALEVQVAEFRQRQIQAEGDIVTANAALNTVLGVPIDRSVRVDGELLERPFAVPSRDELIQTALVERPDYQHQRMTIEARRQDARAARGQYLPRVDAFATVGASSGWNALGSADYSAGVSATWNLFDWGRDSRVKQATAAQDIADAEAQRKADEIRLEVVRAHQAFVTAQERLKVAASVIRQAQEALRIVQDRHGAGLSNVTEVLRAQTALAQARTNLLAARHDYYVGYARTLLVTGRLTDISAFTS